MNNTNTITFKYRYPEGVTEVQKYDIDNAIIFALNKAFNDVYHEGLITDFCLIDEDMEGGEIK